MPEIVDDKSEHCIPFILERLKQHREQYESKGETTPPFFLGLNGVQGAGKTTLVCGWTFLHPFPQVAMSKICIVRRRNLTFFVSMVSLQCNLLP